MKQDAFTAWCKKGYIMFDSEESHSNIILRQIPSHKAHPWHSVFDCSDAHVFGYQLSVRHTRRKPRD